MIAGFFAKASINSPKPPSVRDAAKPEGVFDAVFTLFFNS